MLEESGQVVRTAGELAWVQTARQSSCGGCASRSGCGTGALAGVFGARAHEVEALNPVGAQPGDKVIIGIAESVLVGGSALLYLLPLLSLLVGALLGDSLVPLLAPNTGELPALFGGLVGMLAGFAVLRWHARRSRAEGLHKAVILRREQASAALNFVPHYTGSSNP